MAFLKDRAWWDADSLSSIIAMKWAVAIQREVESSDLSQLLPPIPRNYYNEYPSSNCPSLASSLTQLGQMMSADPHYRHLAVSVLFEAFSINMRVFGPYIAR